MLLHLDFNEPGSPLPCLGSLLNLRGIKLTALLDELRGFPSYSNCIIRVSSSSEIHHWLDQDPSFIAIRAFYLPSLSNVSRAHLLPLTIMMLPMNLKLVSPSIQGKESSNQQSPSILGSIESLSDLACSSFVTWRRRIEPSRSWTLDNSEYDQRTLRKARGRVVLSFLY